MWTEVKDLTDELKDQKMLKWWRAQSIRAVNNVAAGGADRTYDYLQLTQGCDAWILLDDVTGSITREKTAGPNNKSVRGFDTIDTVKSVVEMVCSATVSCADILVIVAWDSVVQVLSSFS
ncbi:cationic peroxidase 1 [Phtheirospermum japonicum]|uniref:peroxidase n=1 Tax=Phtheirospermum japonicum TaxID=374723 RepID=A0A830B9Z3_9LAMI|nr:cationic peroxidase 1 [Phtheirospermum japonicum]